MVVVRYLLGCEVYGIVWVSNHLNGEVGFRGQCLGDNCCHCEGW